MGSPGTGRVTTVSGAEQGARELRLERLVGRRVTGLSGRSVGRLEEVRVEERDGGLHVTQYVLGVTGLVERLGIAVRMLVGSRVRGKVVREDQMDITDPDHPRLTCRIQDLG